MSCNFHRHIYRMTIAPLKEGAVYSAGNRFPVQSKILEEQAQTDTELRQLISKIQEGLSEIQISKT